MLYARISLVVVLVFPSLAWSDEKPRFPATLPPQVRLPIARENQGTVQTRVAVPQKVAYEVTRLVPETVEVLRPDGTKALETRLRTVYETHYKDVGDPKDQPKLPGKEKPTGRVQDVKPFSQLEILGKSRWITYMAFSPDGKTLAASHCWSHGPSFVTLWDTASGKRLREIDGPKVVLSYNPLVFSPDNKWLAVAGPGEVLLLQPDGKRVHQMEQDGEVLHSAFSPGSDLLASCGRGKDVLMWNVATGKKKATLSFDQSIVFSVAFSPEGKTITAVGFDRVDGESFSWVVQVWDASTLKPIRKLSGKEKDRFDDVRLSPDGRALAVQKKDTVELWDTIAGKQVATIKSRGKDWAMHVGLTGDGKAVTTLNVRLKEKTSVEGHLDLWDIKTGQNLVSRNITSDWIEKYYGPYCLIAASGDVAAFQVGESGIALWRTKTLLGDPLLRKKKD